MFSYLKSFYCLSNCYAAKVAEENSATKRFPLIAKGFFLYVCRGLSLAS